MWMADECNATRIMTRNGPKERLEAPGGSIDEESAMKDVAHARENGSVTKVGPFRKRAVQQSAECKLPDYRSCPEIWKGRE
jgi:hypothetical protein